MNGSKVTRIILALAALATIGAPSGCATTDADKGDAGPPQREDCTLRVQACKNSCADLGAGCTLCCDANGTKCDMGADYSFYSCPDKQ